MKRRIKILLVALNNYGIKVAQLADLQTAIDNYSAKTIKLFNAASNRKNTIPKLHHVQKKTMISGRTKCTN
jgi:hypothetical protein